MGLSSGGLLLARRRRSESESYIATERVTELSRAKSGAALAPFSAFSMPVVGSEEFTAAKRRGERLPTHGWFEQRQIALSLGGEDVTYSACASFWASATPL